MTITLENACKTELSKNVHKAQEMGNRMQNLNDMEGGKAIDVKRYIHRIIEDQRDDWVKVSEKHQQILRGC